MRHSELEREQAYVDHAYGCLEAMRTGARDLVDEVVAAGHGGTHGDRVRRDVMVAEGTRRAAELDIGDETLVFGRLDRLDGGRFYVGRAGVWDGDQRQLVVDWRAPVAEPFYRATAVEPMGLRRRRHFLTRGPRILGLDDEIFGRDPAADGGLVLVGEGALMDAVRRARTGRMRDIVATIQAEQDDVIRAPLDGVLVVQGGPGTGKTAVALHRAAYLLYTHRRRLERSGVLLVGPSAVFLRYIEHVLPSLGEKAVKLATAGGLVAGLDTPARDAPEVERVKGDLRLATVVANAVAALERPLAHPVRVLYDDELVELTPADCADVIDRARRLPGPHNPKRPIVHRLLMERLAAAYLDEAGESYRAGRRGPPVVDGLADAARSDPRFRAALDELWPTSTADSLIGELLSSPSRLEAAAADVLAADEWPLLVRPEGSPWTEGDAALLDEAAVLLGPLPRPPRPAPAVDVEELHAIERLLDDVQEAVAMDEVMRRDLLERLVGERLDLEDEQAAEERDTFGHVLVDEAQDLSPMQWRMIARRCPGGSMTILGDLGQASRTWAPAGWEDVTAQLPRLRAPRVAELTINYRTPSEVVDFASPVLAASAPGIRAPTSVRSTGERPRTRRVSAGRVPGAAAAAARAERRRIGEGTVAAIAPASLVDDVRAALGDEAPAPDADVLEAVVAVLTPDEAKGLEFDAVVVVEPAAIVREAPGGLRALYVSLTRPTRRLTVVHAEPLPAPLCGEEARRSADTMKARRRTGDRGAGDRVEEGRDSEGQGAG